MTVKELIEKLKQMPQDDVVQTGHSAGLKDIEHVYRYPPGPNDEPPVTVID